ncbi:MAG: polynucleotide 3-phosphatase [Chlamydiales bacterium]|jgi:protein phosphatase|nr:polynucleotide 3-phosphatase [Chlamydiales bacterium]
MNKQDIFKIPEFCLVILMGISSAGKSSFAKKHFKDSEILSSDFYRAAVSDDENNLKASDDAFEILYFILRKRLANKKLTVIDATNLHEESRKKLLKIAQEYHCLSVLIVLKPSKEICIERNQKRTNRNLREVILDQQYSQLKNALRNLRNERYHANFFLDSLEEIEAFSFERHKLWVNLENEVGPFDIIGDIHGCFDELQSLLYKLGYSQINKHQFRPPAGRKLIFLGDLVDRGPGIVDVLQLVMNMVKVGDALCVPGNHEFKLLRKLQGKNVNLTHGLEQTMEQLAEYSKEFVEELIQFLDSLISHYILDGGKLVVAHAGLQEEYQGRSSGAVRSFAIFGQVTGEMDSDGLPVRLNWAEDYRGKALVVYGHTPVPEPLWLNNTLNIDTGCVFGGALTAFQYPENNFISIPANQVYVEPARPLKKENVILAQHKNNSIIAIDELLGNDIGKKYIYTRLHHSVTLEKRHTIPALEAMSRFAIDPKWLIYLPPTMSPCDPSFNPDYLEYPEEALNYYESAGVQEVVCEEKHMGSRVIVIVCRSAEVVTRRFGVEHESADCIGICYTRNGRRFFKQSDPFEQELLQRLQNALTKANFWGQFQTDWFCFDCELVPWSAKAQQLIKDQYAAVGTSALHHSNYISNKLAEAMCIDPVFTALKQRYKERLQMCENYIKAYRNYCWPINSIDDIKLAPFHILATEGVVHNEQNHLWHMEKITKICEQDPAILRSTSYKVVNFNEPASKQEAIEWWLELTAKGGEGMVVKPLPFYLYKDNKLLQPAIKCRGKEYLRIIYGMEYTREQQLKALKRRNSMGKRHLALQEFALGIEALDYFVSKRPLREIHAYVFAIMALESEPIDPRL